MADTDLADLRKQCITSLYLCTDNMSKYLDEEKETEFNKLKSYVEGYCMLEAQQAVAIQALEKAKRETDITNVDTLQDRFQDQLSSLAGNRLNLVNHPFMTELNKRIENTLQQQARQNLDESDLAITESQNLYIDPITKKSIVDPVKNTICGHVYEKDAIMSLIRVKKTKCPVVGCGNRNPVQQEHLISDEELKFRMTITQHSTMVQERSIQDLDSSMD